MDVNREVLSRGTMRSGEHALWDAHLVRGAARRDMVIAVEIMMKVSTDFERSMLKLADAARAASDLAPGHRSDPTPSEGTGGPAI